MTAPQTITAEELEKFTTGHRREILFYLHQLINDGERVSVVFNEGEETVLTILLDIDESRDLLFFDWGGSEKTNQKLLASERNFFICTPQGVKNQFATGTIRESSFQGRRAFVTPLPGQYTRLQRREFFRLTLPITRRPVCTIRRDGLSSLTLTVIDISIGGLAAELAGGGLNIGLGQILRKVRIDLKSGGILEVDLEVRNIADIQRSGKTATRIGCHFVQLSHAFEHQLQRFITDVQREERARLGG